MTIEPVSVNTEFGTITINNELPDTVTLAVDDQIGAQRVLVLQIDEAYQVVDAVQNAIRDALTRPSPVFPSRLTRLGRGCERQVSRPQCKAQPVNAPASWNRWSRSGARRG